MKSRPATSQISLLYKTKSIKTLNNVPKEISEVDLFTKNDDTIGQNKPCDLC